MMCFGINVVRASGAKVNRAEGRRLAQAMEYGVRKTQNKDQLYMKIKGVNSTEQLRNT